LVCKRRDQSFDGCDQQHPLQGLACAQPRAPVVSMGGENRKRWILLEHREAATWNLSPWGKVTEWCVGLAGNWTQRGMRDAVENGLGVAMFVFDYSKSPPTRQPISQFPLLPSAGVTIHF
jgi:hypothetical protein